MYYLFKEKLLLPHEYYKLKASEKVVLQAFYEKDIDEQDKAYKKWLLSRGR